MGGAIEAVGDTTIAVGDRECLGCGNPMRTGRHERRSPRYFVMMRGLHEGLNRSGSVDRVWSAVA